MNDLDIMVRGQIKHSETYICYKGFLKILKNLISQETFPWDHLKEKYIKMFLQKYVS